MSKTVGIVLLIGIILGILGILAAAVVLMRVAVKPRRSSKERSIGIVKRQGLYGEFDSLPKEEIHIYSYDGYDLHGYYLPAEGESNRYVVITHGITDNCYGSIRYANFYHRLGFHAIAYDMRNHGLNLKTYTTMGLKECEDLRAVIAYVRDRFGEDIALGVHGESLGSSTSILCLNDNLKLAFCVADCGFSNLIQLMKHLVKNEYHVPTFFTSVGNFLVKLFYGYAFSDICPIDNLKENHTPILFMHGVEDTYVPTYMSQDMYDANAGYKEICFFEGARHAKSIEVDPEKYLEVLRDFLARVL